MDRDSQSSHRALHWIMAVLVFALLCSGYYMTYVSDYTLYHWHKSLGVVVAGLLLVRISLRLVRPWRSSLKRRWEVSVSLYHWLLLTVLLVMLLSGLNYSGFGGYGITLFGLELLAVNLGPGNEIVPISAGLSAIGQQVHVTTGYLLLLLLAIHIGAALKHHFIDRDNTLVFMLSGRQ
ncbi:cytochrome b [Microbulbifer aggregans]|uniref:cytochrome b n=1 Tax=Microbulbifer aggregans TaxID=1769779 RepID=UPI001CFD222E|nr:cytochrome b/b6 domain-containing protein [Microbulbifer aggregans]